jgi:flagellar hook-associated protein 2
MASSTISTSGPLFSAGGLSSGLDTNTIVDKLVQIQSQPITNLQTQEKGLNAQISTLGTLISKLSDFATAAKSLSGGGVLASKVSSTNTSFTAVAGTSAVAGTYSVQVGQLATAAKWRSAAFTSSAAGVAAGTLRLTVNGKSYPPADQAPLTITDGMSLADLAGAIRGLGAPVSVSILQGADGSYLSVTNRDTGYDPTLPNGAADALHLDFTATGSSTYQAPGFAQIANGAAQNATFSVDGLDFVRQSNVVSDALPGVTLTLKTGNAAAEDVVLSTDTAGTKANLQKFVDAYNAVMSLVQSQLNVKKDTDRQSTLAGNAAVRSLQAKLQSVVIASVPGLTDVHTLADVGVKTNKDGSLSIDDTTFQSALSRDPNAVNTLFSQSSTGLSDVVGDLVTQQTSAGGGTLVLGKQALNNRIREMDRQIELLQARVDKYKENLQKRFTAMETLLSKLNQTSSSLAAQTARSQS